MRSANESSEIVELIVFHCSFSVLRFPVARRPAPVASILPVKTKQAGAFHGSGLCSWKNKTKSGDQIVPPY